MSAKYLWAAVLLLPCCSAPFEAGEHLDLADLSAGEAGEIGNTAGKDSGKAGSATVPAAGSSGHPSAAGAGGSGSASSAGAGGAAAGHPAQGGGGATTCSLAEAFDSAQLPTAFPWSGFSSKSASAPESSCASSEGGSCSFTVLALNVATAGQNAGALTLQATCDAQIVDGTCGAETACGGLDPARINVRFAITEVDGGFLTEALDPDAIELMSDCDLSAYDRKSSAEMTLWLAAAELVDGKLWRCE